LRWRQNATNNQEVTVTAGSWRAIEYEEYDPRMNIAIDEAILLTVEERAAPSTLRFWRGGNAVIIGYSQNVEEEVHREACAKSDVSIVRRFTGGGAVYQNDGNLNWTVVTRKDDYPGGRIGGISDIFQVFSLPVIKGLHILGLQSRFNPPNGICVGDKKISGMAAYVKRESLLCHGTLLVHNDFGPMRRFLKKLKIDVTTLEETLSRKFSMRDVMNAMVEGFSTTYSISTHRDELSEREKTLAVTLFNEKYVSRRWNYMPQQKASHFDDSIS
jgi:lipoate-protein ligase A